MGTCDPSFPSSLMALQQFPLPDKATSTLLLLLSGAADSLITNICMIPSSAQWYFNMTPFETMFMGLIVLQITILHWLQILPMNINNFIHGMASGRKKKRHVSSQSTDSGRKLSKTMLQALRRLDADECFPRALCEIQYSSINDKYSLPKKTKLILSALKMSSDRRRKSINRKNSTIFQEKDRDEDELLWLEDAVDLGSQLRPSYLQKESSNETVCSTKYKSCPVTTSDILSYFLNIFDFLKL